MHRLPTLLVGLSATAALVGAATPAHALSTSYYGGPVTVSIDSNIDTAWYKQFAMGSDDQRLYADSSSTGGIDVTGPVPTPNGNFGVQDSYVTIVPPQGTALTAGRYSDLNSEYEYPWKAYGLTVSYSIGMDSAAGDVNVLDIAHDATGKLTRFDAVFRTNSQDTGAWAFGEVSMGEPTGAVHLSTRHIVWPTIRQHGGLKAIEVLHNTASTAQRIGSLRISGQSASDYSLLADGCSGRVLQPGASCSTYVTFSPTRGGPRPATLSVPTGSTTQSVSLDGSALLGSSSMTTTGADGIDAGRTGVVTTNTSSTVTAETVLTLPPGGRYGFIAGAESAVVSSGSSSPLAVGTHAVSVDPTSGYSLDVSNGDRGCSDLQGTLSVKDFAVDHDGEPIRANLGFHLICASDPTHPMTGSLLWQERSDITSPRPATGLVVSGTGSSRTARWTTSTSTDRAFTVARLVEGTGANANAASGTALGSGSLTTAALGTLQHGVRYTVLVYTVDTSGNVSAPVTAAVTG